MRHDMSFAIDEQFERVLDERLSQLSCFLGAVPKRPVPLLPVDFVLAGNYIKSFPQHAFSVENKIREGGGYLLSPTCCYPVFHELQGSSHDDELMLTNKGVCFRSEAFYETGTRQIAYLMREYIYMCLDLTKVTDWIESVKQQVSGLLSGLGLNVSVMQATDPFFNENDYKEKIQRAHNLKHEFVVGDVAVGSVNLHLKAFSKSCDITGTDGEHYYSACFGLGYDRVFHQARKVAA